MKKLFIFLNIMLSFWVVVLIYVHIAYQTAPPDKELDMTPKRADIAHVGVFDRATIAMPGDLSQIYDNNIFLVNRGQEEKVPASKQPKPYKGIFELTGLFKIANVQGAIINISGSRKSKASGSKFYRVKDKIAETGYVLEKISPKESTAIISNGRSREVLKLDKNDSGSLKRRQSEVAQQKSRKKQLQISASSPPPPPSRTKVKKPSLRRGSFGNSAEIRKKILERLKAKRAHKK
jgi:hypothetical protein